MVFTDLPAETQDFLLRIRLRAERILALSERFNCVVELRSDLAPSISDTISDHAFGTPIDTTARDFVSLIAGRIFVTYMDNVTKDDVKTFAADAYNHVYLEHIETSSLSHRHRGADPGPPTFVILITGAVFEGDLPKLITGDWTGQTNKAMLYDSSKKVLYGRNGVHMSLFKKVLAEWGSLGDLQNDTRYFGVHLR